MVMNIDSLRLCVNDSTTCYRKHEVDETADRALSDTYPHVSEQVEDASGGTFTADLHFIVVAVNEDRAARHAETVADILAEYPEPERLEGGPSWLELSSILESQELTFRLMAYGAALGWWEIKTPADIDIPEENADEAARNGAVVITGWKPGG